MFENVLDALHFITFINLEISLEQRLNLCIYIKPDEVIASTLQAQSKHTACNRSFGFHQLYFL